MYKYNKRDYVNLFDERHIEKKNSIVPQYNMTEKERGRHQINYYVLRETNVQKKTDR